MCLGSNMAGHEPEACPLVLSWQPVHNGLCYGSRVDLLPPKLSPGYVNECFTLQVACWPLGLFQSISTLSQCLCHIIPICTWQCADIHCKFTLGTEIMNFCIILWVKASSAPPPPLELFGGQSGSH